MATWDDIVSYIRSTYKIADDTGILLRLKFTLENGRRQEVLVGRGTTKGVSEEFAQIASVFADAESVDIGAVLREASEYIVGGIVQYGNKLAVRHTVPLANLDLSEFTGPLDLVLYAADQLEERYTGADRN